MLQALTKACNIDFRCGGGVVSAQFKSHSQSLSVQFLLQAEGFFTVLFLSNQRIEQEVGVGSAVMWMFFWSVMVKMKLTWKLYMIL